MNDTEAVNAAAAIQAVLHNMLKEAESNHDLLTTFHGASVAEAASVLRDMNKQIADLQEWIGQKTATEVPIKFVDKIGGLNGRRRY
jgi:hypothetical protein